MPADTDTAVWLGGRLQQRHSFNGWADGCDDIPFIDDMISSSETVGQDNSTAAAECHSKQMDFTAARHDGLCRQQQQPQPTAFRRSRISDALAQMPRPNFLRASIKHLSPMKLSGRSNKKTVGFTTDSIVDDQQQQLIRSRRNTTRSRSSAHLSSKLCQSGSQSSSTLPRKQPVKVQSPVLAHAEAADVLPELAPVLAACHNNMSSNNRANHHHSLPRRSHLQLNAGSSDADGGSAVWLQGRNKADGDSTYITRIPIYPDAIQSVPSKQPGSSSGQSVYFYELSDDFRQKQIDMLERKYGGARRAQLAATSIQRAYREYSMRKRWQQVRNPPGRRSRAADRQPTTQQSAATVQQGAPGNTGRRTPPTARRQLHVVNQPPPHGLASPGSAPILQLHKCYGVANQQQRYPVAGVNISNHYIQQVQYKHTCTTMSQKQQQQTRSASTERSRRHTQDGVDSEQQRRILSDVSMALQTECSASPSCSDSYLSYTAAHSNDESSTVFASSSACHMDNVSSSSGIGSAVPSPNSPTSSSAASTPQQPPSVPVWIPQPAASSTSSLLPAKPKDGSKLQRSAMLRHTSAPGVGLSRQSCSTQTQQQQHTVSDRKRRLYRVALNFFNKKPERGMQLLMQFGFFERSPQAVARFLLTRRGLSKQMIGEYLGFYHSFNAQVLQCFTNEVDLRNQEIDEALRAFLTLFRLPGEAQKIDRVVQAFARRYCACNRTAVAQFRSADTVFVLAFAIVMLNTDLHSPNIKHEKRMKLADFIKNLRGIDDGADVDAALLTGIYKRIKQHEFVGGNDHVTQVLKVDKSIVGAKKPTLALPHRRLVCYCRLQEVVEPAKKQAPTAHTREVFLFNDLIVITKALSKKKNGQPTYQYRASHSLVGMQVQAFKTAHYQHAIKLYLTLENKWLIFNARNNDDKIKFQEDLVESVRESDEMEQLRIELELEKQSLLRGQLDGGGGDGGSSKQRDSGLPDENTLKQAHRALSNSMLELVAGAGRSAPAAEPPQPQPQQQPAASGSAAQRMAAALAQHDDPTRRASVNSFDSGMSSTASVDSRDCSPKGSQPQPQLPPVEPTTPKP